MGIHQMLGEGVARQIAVVNPYPTYAAETRAAWATPNVFDSVPSLVLHNGDTFGQIGPAYPADNVASLVFGDNGYVAADFAEFLIGSDVAPTYIDEIHPSVNGQSVNVSPSTLVGIAEGQGLLMLIGMTSALTTLPGMDWTAHGQLVQASSAVDVYVYSKIATATDLTAAGDFVLAHTGGGRLAVSVTNWDNADPDEFVPIDAVFQPFTSVDPVASGVTPPHNNAVVVSHIYDSNNPVYTAAPPGFTLISQFAVSGGVGWQGVAYKEVAAQQATGDIDWNISVVGGSKVSALVILKGQGQTIERRTFFVPMRHHTDTGPGEDGLGNTDWVLEMRYTGT